MRLARYFSLVEFQLSRRFEAQFQILKSMADPNFLESFDDFHPVKKLMAMVPRLKMVVSSQVMVIVHYLRKVV